MRDLALLHRKDTSCNRKERNGVNLAACVHGVAARRETVAEARRLAPNGNRNQEALTLAC